MKKIIILLIFVFIQNQFTFATSGNTDAKGCHRSKIEGYHCHGSHNDLAGVAAVLIVGAITLGISSAYKALSNKNNESQNNSTDIKYNNSNDVLVDPNYIEYSQENNIEVKNEIINIHAENIIEKELTVMERLNRKIENDNKMKDLFGYYINESINTNTLKKVGDFYEFININDKIGFDKYYLNIKDQKVKVILSNKIISNDRCKQEKENFKDLIEKKFGNQYKITISESAYLFNYKNFMSMISCKSNKLSFVVKGK